MRICTLVKPLLLLHIEATEVDILLFEWEQGLGALPSESQARRRVPASGGFISGTLGWFPGYNQ